jgi:hypothetical protein
MFLQCIKYIILEFYFSLCRGKQDIPSKTKRKCGSNNRAPASQMAMLEFKPQYHQNKTKRRLTMGERFTFSKNSYYKEGGSYLQNLKIIVGLKKNGNRDLNPGPHAC